MDLSQYKAVLKLLGSCSCWLHVKLATSTESKESISLFTHSGFICLLNTEVTQFFVFSVFTEFPKDRF